MRLDPVKVAVLDCCVCGNETTDRTYCSMCKKIVHDICRGTKKTNSTLDDMVNTCNLYINEDNIIRILASKLSKTNEKKKKRSGTIFVTFKQVNVTLLPFLNFIGDLKIEKNWRLPNRHSLL